MSELTIKISELPSADDASGVEIFPVVQSGVTRKMDLSQIFSALTRQVGREEITVGDTPYTFQEITYNPESDLISVFINGSLLLEEDYTATASGLTLSNPSAYNENDDLVIINLSSGVGVSFSGSGIGFVSVEQYGASPSASPSQNHTAIMTALSDNAGKRAVLFEGIYTVNATILIPSNTYLKGVGRDVSGVRMASNVPRDEPLILTGHRLQKGENIILEGFKVDSNRDRWSIESGAGSTWQALTPSGPGARHESNQDVTRSGVMVCNSERVIVRDILSIDSYKHNFDVSAPWYGRGANTPDPENPGQFISTALQYDPDPARYVWFENCEAINAGDDNFTAHQCSFTFWKDCVARNTEGEGGGMVPGNTNGFEIDDGARNAWLSDCITFGCSDGVQVKGHNDAPAPYNVFMSNIMAVNCRGGLEIRHTGWYGNLEDEEDLEPILDEDGNVIPVSGGSQTARNIQITNFQVIAPRRTLTSDNVERAARGGARIRSYENVVINGFSVSDGSLDLAKAIDGYSPTTPLGAGMVIQLNRGVRNTQLNNVVVSGFSNANSAIRIYGTAGDGISVDGFAVTNGPKHGLYQSGSVAVSVDNYNLSSDQTALSDSYGIRLTSNDNSFIGRGKVEGYSRPARFGGEEFESAPFSLYQPLFGRLGARFRTTNSDGVDIARSSTAGHGRMLRCNNAGVNNGFIFSTSNLWLNSREGSSLILGFSVAETSPSVNFDVKTYGGVVDNFTPELISDLELEVGDSVRIQVPSQGWDVVHTVTNTSENSPLGSGFRVVFFTPALPTTESFPTYTEYSATFTNTSKSSDTGTPESSSRRKGIVSVVDNSIAPTTGGAAVGNVSLGRADSRWTEVFATNGTINTSDARTKTQVRSMTEDEVNAAKQICQEIGVFKFLESIAEKGEDNAREHIGMTVQRVIEIMEDNNLEPLKYSFICHDEWDATDAVFERDEEDNLIEVDPARSAGDVYSFRYDELNLFIARGFEARISALENGNG